MTRSAITLLRAAAFAACLLPTAALAQQEAKPAAGTAGAEAEFCIPLSQIDRTEVVDSRTILVRMVGGQQDRKITLVNRCPGLRFNGFAHETSINRLCKTDPLRVIETNGVGATCVIEAITPITKAEADALAKRG